VLSLLLTLVVLLKKKISLQMFKLFKKMALKGLSGAGLKKIYEKYLSKTSWDTVPLNINSFAAYRNNFTIKTYPQTLNVLNFNLA
jgi:hypothetical protein